MKKANRLWIFALALYWLFAFLFIIPNNPIGEWARNQYFAYLFPPKYRMFAPPPITSVSIDFSFYKNGKLVEKVNSLAFNKSQLIDNKLSRRKIQLQKELYFGGESQFIYQTSNYFLKKVRNQPNDFTLQEYLNKNREARRFVANSQLYHHLIQEKNPTLKNVDSIVYQIHWNYLTQENYRPKPKQISEFIGDTILIQKTLK